MSAWDILQKKIDEAFIRDLVKRYIKEQEIKESPVGGGAAEDGEGGAPVETEVEETY